MKTERTSVPNHIRTSSLFPECAAGKYGRLCEEDCMPNCKKEHCHKSSGYCSVCLDSYYGVECELSKY